jgi:uncharacterized iron-regulated membrane protein
MKIKRYKHYIRKSHRYLGIFIGIQFLFWTLGGLYFSWTNIKQIRGDHLRNEEAVIKNANGIVSPQTAMGRLENGTSIQKVELIEVLGLPHYSIKYKQPDGKNRTAIANAANGELRENISETEAKEIALRSLKQRSEIKIVEYITEENVNTHHEYREKPLPAWAVTFDNSENLTVYLSAETGQIVAFRTGAWRVFDFLWMLHTMGFQDRDDINNYVLRGFSVLGMATILSGFALFFVSSRFFRRLLR